MTKTAKSAGEWKRLFKTSEAARRFQTAISQVLSEYIAAARNPECVKDERELQVEAARVLNELIPLAVKITMQSVQNESPEVQAVFERVGNGLLEASNTVHDIQTKTGGTMH